MIKGKKVLERALDKVCEVLSKEETCHKGKNQVCKDQVVTLDECKKCWEDWCLDETK